MKINQRKSLKTMKMMLLIPFMSSLRTTMLYLYLQSLTKSISKLLFNTNRYSIDSVQCIYLFLVFWRIGNSNSKQIAVIVQLCIRLQLPMTFLLCIFAFKIVFKIKKTFLEQLRLQRQLNLVEKQPFCYVYTIITTIIKCHICVQNIIERGS